MASRPLFARALSSGAYLLALVLLATLPTRLHPVFDSLSQFRVHLAFLLVAIAIGALLAGAWRAGIAGLLCVGLLAAATYPYLPLLPADATASGRTVRIAQFNTLYRNGETERAARILRAADPDVIMLEEATNGPRALANLLRKDYPVQARCGRAGVSGATVLSRLPAAETQPIACLNSHALSAIRLTVGESTITFAAFHGQWPWPYAQAETIDRLSRDLATLQHPLIIAGDFNAAPWAEGVQQVARITGTRPAAGLRPTWLTARLPDALRPWLGLPIDHVLVSDDLRMIAVRRLDFAGSDHLPVVADIAY